jgi:DUF1009 family protein
MLAVTDTLNRGGGKVVETAQIWHELQQAEDIAGQKSPKEKQL